MNNMYKLKDKILRFKYLIRESWNYISHPYVVRSSSFSFEYELLEWLQGSGINYIFVMPNFPPWKRLRICDIKNNDVINAFRFRYKKDALLFKMTWG